MGLVRLPFTGCFGENFHNFYKDRKFAGPLRMEGMEKLTRKGRIPHMVISPLIVRQGADIRLLGAPSTRRPLVKREPYQDQTPIFPWDQSREEATGRTRHDSAVSWTPISAKRKSGKGGNVLFPSSVNKPQNPRRLLTTLDTSFDFVWHIF